MAVVVKWNLYDPTVPEGYTFEVNPNQGGTPPLKKAITYQSTTSPFGKTLIFEGRDQVQEETVSGTLLTQVQLENLQYWFDKRHQVLLTDDLGRQYWIYITSFTPKRERARSHPWKHSYELSYTILDNPA